MTLPSSIYTNKGATALITPPAIPLHPTDVEWVRSDLAQAMVAKAREDALREAAKVAKGQYSRTPQHDPDSPFFGSDMSPDRSDWGRGIQRGRENAADAILALIDRTAEGEA